MGFDISEFVLTEVNVCGILNITKEDLYKIEDCAEGPVSLYARNGIRYYSKKDVHAYLDELVVNQRLLRSRKVEEAKRKAKPATNPYEKAWETIMQGVPREETNNGWR